MSFKEDWQKREEKFEKERNILLSGVPKEFRKLKDLMTRCLNELDYQGEQ